jgi:tetratricopeptide (TPR) repeat protein
MFWNKNKKPATPPVPDIWLGRLIDGGQYVPAVNTPNREPQPEISHWGPRRLNIKAVAIVGGATLLVALLCIPVWFLQQRSLRRSALEQARKAYDDGHIDQALVNIDAYLDTWPDDLDGLAFKGEMVWKANTSAPQILKGILALDSLLRLDPDPPARQDDRKRLVELSIRLGDMVRAGSERANVGTDKFEARYRFANKVAEQRVKLGADDGEAHRLLAMTLERLSMAGDAAAGPEAIAEYQKALRKDPGDFTSAEHLATLRMERRKDLAGADQILDNLVKARPRSIEARLARARHLLRTGREERAKADVETASKMEAADKGVRLMAASLAIRRGDVPAARRHLAAIPAEGRDDNRLDVLLAQIDFLERKPDKAIEKIRAGLARNSGTDRELTWRLAYWLIQLGRPAEARPLMAQFRRLAGRQDHPMTRFLEGMILEKSGRHASAIAQLEPAREEIDGEWKGEVDSILGRCHEVVGDAEAAEADYVRARDASPTSPGPRLALSRLLMRTDPDRAIAELEAGLRSSPASAPLMAELAIVQVAKQLAAPATARNWSAAEAALDRATRAKADDPTVIRARTTLLMASGREAEAVSALEEATKGLARGQDEVWLARARLLESRGKTDEAVAALEQASKADACGDLAMLRVARASALAKTGHGRAALALLASDVEKFSIPDRALLAREKAGLLAGLGDRQGALLACEEWASFAPEDPGPGLRLVEMSRRGGNEKELERGVELLKKVGGEDEPVALAAQAIALLLPEGDAGEPDGTRVDQAEKLARRLQTLAPNLSVTSLVSGLILEQSSDFEEAISSYKLAIKGDATGLALPRLVALLTRLKKDDELAKLKEKSAPAASAIDRLSVAQSLRSGDKEQAETLLYRLVEAQPDSLEFRADLARLLRELGKPEQAEATLRELIERQPERPQGWLALMAMQLQRGDRAAAQGTVERLKKGEYTGERADLLLTRCLLSLGDRDGAAQACGRELARRPDDLVTLQVASEVEEAIGHPARAEELVARARKLDPKLPWARRRLALLLSGRPTAPRWAEARALVDPSAVGSVESPEDRITRAIVLERGPEPAHRAEAIAVLRSLADDLPVSSPVGKRARTALTRSLLATNDPAGAAKTIAPSAVESASPDNPTLVLAVESLARDGQAEEARKLFERLVKADPDSPQTTACRALVLKAEGDIEGAALTLADAASAASKAPDGERLNRFYFDRLAQLGPEAASAVERLGRELVGRWPAQGAPLARIMANAGRADEALETLRPVIAAGQCREPLQVILSLQAANKLGGPLDDKARELAIEGAIRAPKDGQVLAMTTAVLRAQKRYVEEAELYRKLLASDAENVVARNNLAWVLGQDLDKPAEALAEVDRVIAKIGPLPQAVDTRGVILIKLDRVKEAIDDLEKATKDDPSAIHHLHLARAYARAGRDDDRLRNLQAAKLAAAKGNTLAPEDRAELDAVK